MADNNSQTPIESPCVRNCCLNEDNVCLGCFRTVDEICKWSASSDDEKRQVLEACAQRRIEYAARYKRPRPDIG